jgi:hypothetical protein
MYASVDNKKSGKWFLVLKKGRAESVGHSKGKVKIYYIGGVMIRMV